MAAFEIHALGEDDAPRMARLHPGLEARTRWLARHPSAQRQWGAFRDGEALACLAALPLRTWVAGRETHFAQRLPVVVADGPSAAERSALVGALNEVLAAEGGGGGDFVHFDWPTDDEWRGGGCSGADIVRTQTVLERTLPPGSTELPPGLERVERFDQQALWMWERCAGDFGASTIRDDAFLNWRLFDAPGPAFDVLGSRDADGVLRGTCAVLPPGRGGRWGSAAVLVEWLVPPGEPEVGRRLAEGVESLARAQGARAVRAALVEWSPWFESFQARGYRVLPSRLFPVAWSHVRRFEHLWLRDHWWTTPIDSLLEATAEGTPAAAPSR